MTGKPTARVVAVIALLILVAAALHGYLPAAHQRPRISDEGGNPAALMFLVAIMAATLGLLAFAVIMRLRDPRTVAPSSADLSDMLGSDRGARPSWRVILIVAAALLAWVLIVMTVSRIFPPSTVSFDVPQRDSSDQTTQPPAPGAVPAAKQPQQQKNKNGDPLGLLLASAVPLVLVFVAGAVVATHRRGRSAKPGGGGNDDGTGPAPTPATESLARAAEVGLAEMTDRSREPREAIIACYAAMEKELANVPGAAPQEYDTPTEVLARAVERHALQADNAIQLVNLFEEARFSPHVMNEGHREVATGVLELVLSELAPRSGTAS